MSNPIASTSKSVSKASPKFDLLKRKERDDDEQQQQPKNDDDGEEKKQDAVAEDPTAAFLSWKKPKKEKKVLVRRVVEKKIAVWKDIGEWQEGDDPLGRFPVEVLDLIISIDSDLDVSTGGRGKEGGRCGGEKEEWREEMELTSTLPSFFPLPPPLASRSPCTRRDL
ncbi:hypothetical protein BDY24DRAFT_12013 [Mrakia frigida]|uniref:uncharacterized protein n=1 Tax=Mrakia frigida TaxID=29902 RepID=UPI003FCC06F4